MKRMLAGVVAAALLLTGCDTVAAGDSGIVTDKWTHDKRYFHGLRYYLEIDAAHGPKDSARVSRRTYEACHVGDVWPGCRDE